MDRDDIEINYYFYYYIICYWKKWVWNEIIGEGQSQTRIFLLKYSWVFRFCFSRHVRTTTRINTVCLNYGSESSCFLLSDYLFFFGVAFFLDRDLLHSHSTTSFITLIFNNLIYILIRSVKIIFLSYV